LEGVFRILVKSLGWKITVSRFSAGGQEIADAGEVVGNHSKADTALYTTETFCSGIAAAHAGAL
jgi:hypothetical protein